MSDSKTTGDKTISVPANKTLTLKRPVEQGTVKQSFSHGRTKSVVVETVKRRHSQGDVKPVAPPPVQETRPQPARPPVPPARPGAAGAAPRPAAGGRTLTEDERDARAQVLQEARRRDEEARRAEMERRQREERAAAEAAARAREEERRQKEEAARKRAEEEAAARSAEASPRPAPAATEAPAPPKAAAPAPAAAPARVELPLSGGRPPVLGANARPIAAPASRPAEADGARAESPRQETSRQEVPRQDSPRQETPRPAGFRQDGPREQGRESSRFETPRPDVTRTYDGRPPRLDGPRFASGERRPEGPRSFDGPRGENRPAEGRSFEGRPGESRGFDRSGPGDRGPGGERRFDGPRSFDGPRGDGPRGDRPPRAFDGPRGPRPDGDRGPGGERRFDGPRSFDGPRGDGPRGDRPPRAFDGPRGPRPEGDRGPGGERRFDGPRSFDGPRGDGPRGDRPPRSFDGPRGDGGPRPAGTVRLGFGPAPGSAPRGDARGPRTGGPRGAPPPVPTVADELRPIERQRTDHVARAPRDIDEDEAGGRPARRGVGAKVPAPAKPERTKGGENKMRGRLTVASATTDGDERMRSVASFRRRVQRMKGGGVEQKEKISREVIIPETITIQELANRMSERGVDVIRLLMKQGALHKITDVIDADTAQLVAEELGHTVKRVSEADVIEGLFDAPDEDDSMTPRPPVVTIMGHVDHGKTSLLDAIRKTNVVSGEAGGITQHIGAYQVTSPLGGKITFIDTPGHAAFTAMRARGARVTDIVVLVVAANDSVMPQTIEAINHAKAARVPIIVAINKIDLPEAEPQRVRNDLLRYEVQVESQGGDTLEVEVSAKNRLNLDKLLETIQLQSEVLDLRANPDRPAEGSVVEAKLDRGRGPVATVLVQRGTLRQGDIVVAGAEWGRVRALINDQGEPVSEAAPSVPVEVLGFNGAPEAGDRVAVVESEARAREITEYRERVKREQAAARGATQSRSLADMMKQLKDAAGRKEFPLVVKGDVQGSVEAIAGALEKLGNDEVAARVLHSGVGGITESDITLASATGAVVLGFNVRAHKEAREAAERQGVEIRYYNIIYDLVDDVKSAMSGLLPPTLREEMLGNAEILEVFNITKVGKVAGCRVTDGRVERGAKVRLIRDNVVIHEGTLSTLKRFKDEVKDVQVGQECGMAFERYEDMQKGDVIECYLVHEVKRTL